MNREAKHWLVWLVWIRDNPTRFSRAQNIWLNTNYTLRFLRALGSLPYDR